MSDQVHVHVLRLNGKDNVVFYVDNKKNCLTYLGTTDIIDVLRQHGYTSQQYSSMGQIYTKDAARIFWNKLIATKLFSHLSTLAGKQFVFTGFRDADLKASIESREGVVADKVTKSTTHLIWSGTAKGIATVKQKQAKGVGAQVWTRSELEAFLTKI
jgi:NAD-dependent DNA ligase